MLFFKPRDLLSRIVDVFFLKSNNQNEAVPVCMCVFLCVAYVRKCVLYELSCHVSKIKQQCQYV